MTFYSGQKVICINAVRDNTSHVGRALRWMLGRDWPVEGSVYTILRPFVDVVPLGVGVELLEIKNSWIVQRCFRASRFRPLVETETDISIFTAMLNTLPADLVGEVRS